MKRPSAPLKRYAFPALGPLGWVVVELTRESFAQTIWWAELPWEAIGLLGIGTLVGWVGADLFNRHSDLRVWLRWVFRLFEMEALIPATFPSNPDRFVLVAKLRLRFNVASQDMLFTVLRNIRDGAATDRLAFGVPLENSLQRGETAPVVLANIPRTAPNADNPNARAAHEISSGPVLAEGSKNIIEVKVRKFPFSQRLRVYLELQQSGAGTGGRFWFIGEGDDLFDLDGH